MITASAFHTSSQICLRLKSTIAAQANDNGKTFGYACILCIESVRISLGDGNSTMHINWRKHPGRTGPEHQGKRGRMDAGGLPFPAELPWGCGDVAPRETSLAHMQNLTSDMEEVGWVREVVALSRWANTRSGDVAPRKLLLHTNLTWGWARNFYFLILKWRIMVYSNALTNCTSVRSPVGQLLEQCPPLNFGEPHTLLPPLYAHKKHRIKTH